MVLIRLSAFVMFVLCTSAVWSADRLTIGSPAPSLDIEHWVQDGKGSFKPVTNFTAGKVYVVEFWATWCGPCVASMPHLAGLQKEYADSVQIVSISDEDLGTVQRFLERPYEARSASPDEDSPKTYAELTSAYCLTTDPDQSSYRDYMEAAEQGGIPTAFIVGKDAKIEWIGHPMEMDKPLADVVQDRWDREAYRRELELQSQIQRMLVAASEKLRKQDIDGGLKLLDEVIELKPNQPELKLQRLALLVQFERFDEANQYLNKLFAETFSTFQEIDGLAWNIYEFGRRGLLPKGDLTTTAIKAAKAASEKAEGKEKSSLFDTLAHLSAVDGKIDEAIAYETQAVALADGEYRESFQNYLEELKREKDAPAETSTDDN